jgi:hypothetical protein
VLAMGLRAMGIAEDIVNSLFRKQDACATIRCLTLSVAAIAVNPPS